MSDVTTVTLTVNAGRDDLSAEDYRDIYQELRHYAAETGRYGVSLDAFVALICSAFSKAAWSKVHNGHMELNRTMRNELRAAVGRPPLPPSVAEVTASLHPDALVVQVGVGRPDRALLIADPDPLLITLNGALAVERPHPPAPAAVTPVTPRHRRPYARPCATPEQNERRAALGVAWAEVIESGLRILEAA